MGVVTAIILIAIAIGLLWAAQKGRINQQSLGLLSSIAGIVAAIAAIVLFIIPAASTPSAPSSTAVALAPTNTFVPIVVPTKAQAAIDTAPTITPTVTSESPTPTYTPEPSTPTPEPPTSTKTPEPPSLTPEPPTPTPNKVDIVAFSARLDKEGLIRIAVEVFNKTDKDIDFGLPFGKVYIIDNLANQYDLAPWFWTRRGESLPEKVNAGARVSGDIATELKINKDATTIQAVFTIDNQKVFADPVQVPGR